MIIEAPFTVSVIESQSLSQRELQLAFTEEFRDLNLTQRIRQWDAYIHRLRRDSAMLLESDADRQGMLTLLQVVEPMREHIADDTIDLQQTLEIVIKGAAGMH